MYVEKMTKEAEVVDQNLAKAGFKSAIVSLQRLDDIRSDFEQLHAQGSFDEVFFNERLDHYIFEPPEDMPDAKSIIIIAVRQARIRVYFTTSGKTYSVIIPPTYSDDTDKRAFRILNHALGDFGYRVSDAVLPVKALAVRCGLAEYGKNNITYIQGWGSFFRLKAFYTDMPFSTDTWQEYTIMDCCDTCTACLKKCPAGAISDDRFVFHAERCLTLLNEGASPFPEWIGPTWHNCLVGCMICQDVCPANKDYTNWIVEDGAFSEEETSMILKGVSENKIPLETKEKLEKLDMMEYYDLLGRNLGVLIRVRDDSPGEHKFTV